MRDRMVYNIPLKTTTYRSIHGVLTVKHTVVKLQSFFAVSSQCGSPKCFPRKIFIGCVDLLKKEALHSQNLVLCARLPGRTRTSAVHEK
jgi:hypothetical protein